MNEAFLKEKHEEAAARLAACPEEKRRAAAKYALSLAATVLWFAVWIESAVRYFRHSYATFNPFNVVMIVSVIVLTVLPFRLFHPLRVFTEKTYCGVIRQVKARENAGLTVLVRSTKLVLVIEGTDGKKRKKKIERRAGFLGYYEEGTPVSVFRGVAYPVKLDAPADGETVLCQHCGSFEPRRYTRCFECRHALWNK